MEEKKEEEKVEAPITETTSIIDKADAVAKRMQEQNDRAEQLLIRQEAIAARMMLSGRAEAGQVNKTKEQTDAEEVEKRAQAALKMFK